MRAAVQAQEGGRTGAGNVRRIAQALIRNNSVVILVLLFIISSLLSSAFLSEGNLYNLLRQLTPLLLVSLGMLLVVNTGGIDLSVGSIAGAGGLLVAIIVPSFGFDGPFALLVAVAACVLVGALFGAASGLLVAFADLAPFIVTLAMMTVVRGITFMMSNGQPLQLPSELRATDVLDSFGSDGLPMLGVPWPVILGAVVILALYFVMSHLTFGRMVIATGSNEVAVRLAGISARKYKFLVYVFSGALAGLAGVVITSRTDVGTPIAGLGLELDAIAACVIGGALLSGGKGTVINTVIGVLVLGLIGNVMNLLSVPAYPQQIIKGLIILAAVLMQRFSSREGGM
jgi:ribose transport system permease protein